jgi:hypothetical protein
MEGRSRAVPRFPAAEGVASSMRKITSYPILKMALMSSLGILTAASLAFAQQSPNAPREADVYCSGMATTQPIPNDTYVISGENSSYRMTYSEGEQVFLNRGADQGVKVGDQYTVMRRVREPVKYKWFTWQPQLMRAMGPVYADIGRLRVVNVLAKTSTAEVTYSCDMMYRGDIALPFAPRPAPAFHDVKFDQFAPPSGKPTAMVVTGKDFAQLVGTGSIVYVNLGATQGVKVGDYFRVFRYQGTRNQTAYQTANTSYKMYGYGSTPVAYRWDNLPRQILGEGIVLHASPNSSTVLLTHTLVEIFAGDYVELE